MATATPPRLFLCLVGYSDGMELTFVGHQTWFISHGDTHLLLDPVLDEHFGHCREVDFRVYPPRHVDVAKMPRPTGLLLSHEHLDHFHLPSLNLLPRDIPFYVGHLLPTVVSEAIEALGFKVTRIRTEEPFQLGGFEVVLYSRAADEVFWERRVTQVLVTPVDAPELGVFVGVDSGLAPQYAAEVQSGARPSPRALVVANNSQFAPPGATGTHSNFLNLDAGLLSPRVGGFALMKSLFLDYQQDMEVENIIVCGNGFMNFAESFGPFLLSDNKRLAAIANELAYRTFAFGPYPGETLTFQEGAVATTQADWIELDRPLIAELLARQAAFLKSPPTTVFESISPAFTSDNEAERALKRVERELEVLGPALMRSRVGALALCTEEHLRGPLGPRRVVFRFHGGPGNRVHAYALDLSDAHFHPDPHPEEDPTEVYPFGLEAYLQDFHAVVEGDLQIWDLAGNAVRSWYMGPKLENLPAFLFEFYGEQSRPDLARSAYRGALERLRAEKR